MTKQKKSFLDKIMGTEGETEDKEILNKDESGSDPVVAEEGLGEDVLNKELENQIKAEEQKEVKKDVPVDASKKNWFKDKDAPSSEEEGQLTIDVFQTKDHIVIKSIIGGVRPEDLDIAVTADMVTIKGARQNPDEVKPDDYYYQECFWGNFSRSIILPCDIRSDEVEAKMKNGILTVRLPKIEKNSSMKIQVKEE
ncbi:MAG: Hsp20/alpha crystallin family protein [Candidatus Paceibacterota bacterium]|jgi:HSP20 family protein